MLQVCDVGNIPAGNGLVEAGAVAEHRVQVGGTGRHKIGQWLVEIRTRTKAVGECCASRGCPSGQRPVERRALLKHGGHGGDVAHIEIGQWLIEFGATFEHLLHCLRIGSVQGGKGTVEIAAGKKHVVHVGDVARVVVEVQRDQVVASSKSKGKTRECRDLLVVNEGRQRGSERCHFFVSLPEFHECTRNQNGGAARGVCVCGIIAGIGQGGSISPRDGDVDRSGKGQHQCLTSGDIADESDVGFHVLVLLLSFSVVCFYIFFHPLLSL